MYLFPSVAFNPATSTSYYTVIAGRYAGQLPQMGSEEDSSELRGMLLAILLGLEKISHQHSVQIRHKVDILVTDDSLRQQIQAKKWPSLLTSDQDDLWHQLHKWSEAFQIRYVSSPDQSEHMLTIISWSSVPPVRAELPAGY